MTKSELMAHLAEKYLAQGHSRLAVKDVEQSVKVLVDAMTRALARGQRIEIRGFGSFDLNHRPARIGRNPKTGEKVTGIPFQYSFRALANKPSAVKLFPSG